MHTDKLGTAQGIELLKHMLQSLTH